MMRLLLAMAASLAAVCPTLAAVPMAAMPLVHSEPGGGLLDKALRGREHGLLTIERAFAPPPGFEAASPALQMADLAKPSVPIVPEPAGWAMMLAGLGFSGWALRRRTGRIRPARSPV